MVTTGTVAEQRVLLDNISWQTFEAMLKDLGEDRSFRLTKVMLEWTEGSGLADRGIIWDIRTDVIPLHLRMIGARFLLLTQPVQQTHNGRSGKSTLEVLELRSTSN